MLSRQKEFKRERRHHTSFHRRRVLTAEGWLAVGVVAFGVALVLVEAFTR